MAGDFLQDLTGDQRQVLLGLARGKTNHEIVETGLSEILVETTIDDFGRWLRPLIQGKVTREAMAFYVIDHVLTPEELAELRRWAQENYRQLWHEELLADEWIIREAVRPENLGLSYKALATEIGAEPQQVENVLKSAAKAVGGHGRVRLLVVTYLLDD